jgi:hypothetical protein
VRGGEDLAALLDFYFKKIFFNPEYSSVISKK